MDYLQEDYYPAPPPHPSSTLPPHSSSTIPSDAPSPLQQPTSTLPPYNPDPYNSMPPPPEATYATLPALMTACQSHARHHGYACVTSSNNYKRGIAYVRCDRGGEYVNHWNLTPETRVRKNRTRRLVGCKWKARAKRNKEGEWVLTMMHDKHTGHDASASSAAHPSLRQLPDEAVQVARGAFGEGRSPKEVLDLLKQNFNEAITAQDVYNLKAKIARLEHPERTPRKGRVGGGGGLSLDPALETQGGAENGGGPQGTAQVARMQDVDQTCGTNHATPESAGHARPQKCSCTCCEH